MRFCAEMTVFPGGGVDRRRAASTATADSPDIGWQGPSTDWWAERLGTTDVAAP